MKSTLIKSRLVLIENGRVLLLRQTKKNGGNYTLVGGKVEAGENARKCLVREGREEAGIILREEDLQLAHVLHKNTPGGHRVTMYFQTRKWQGHLRSREPHKFKSVEWCSVHDLPQNITGTVRHVLEQIQEGHLYSEFSKKNLLKKIAEQKVL